MYVAPTLYQFEHNNRYFQPCSDNKYYYTFQQVIDYSTKPFHHYWCYTIFSNIALDNSMFKHNGADIGGTDITADDVRVSDCLLWPDQDNGRIRKGPL